MSSGAGVGVFVVGEVESLSWSCEFWGTEEVDAGTERRNEEDQGPNRPDEDDVRRSYNSIQVPVKGAPTAQAPANSTTVTYSSYSYSH